MHHHKRYSYTSLFSSLQVITFVALPFCAGRLGSFALFVSSWNDSSLQIMLIGFICVHHMLLYQFIDCSQGSIRSFTWKPSWL